MFAELSFDEMEIILPKMAAVLSGSDTLIPTKLLLVCKYFHRALLSLATALHLTAPPPAVINQRRLRKVALSHAYGSDFRLDRADLARIFKLTQLTHLDLGRKAIACPLAHLAPVSTLSSLKFLSMECSAFHDATAAPLAALVTLPRLHLAYCTFSEAGFAHLRPLTALRHLSFKGCRSPSCAGLRHLPTSLLHLDLDSCYTLVDGDVWHLSRLAALQRLSLRRCYRVTAEALEHLKPLSALKHLDLMDCVWCKGAGVSSLAALSALQHLDARGWANDDAVAHCSALPDLTHLSLGASSFASASPFGGAGLAHVAGLPQLQELSLHGCSLTDDHLVHVSGMAALTHLSLAACHCLTGLGLAHLSQLSSLRQLDLTFCKHVTQAGVAHLAGLAAPTLKISQC